MFRLQSSLQRFSSLIDSPLIMVLNQAVVVILLVLQYKNRYATNFCFGTRMFWCYFKDVTSIDSSCVLVIVVVVLVPAP